MLRWPVGITDTGAVLFLHELHEVRGPEEGAFEACVRDEWLPALAAEDGARLLGFLRHAHGSGDAYHVVTITALRDGAAWERLVRRVDGGDLGGLSERLDALRHDVTAKQLIPLPWSPLQRVELDDVPTAAAKCDPILYMEDTVWPYEGRFEQYVERSGSHYYRSMQELRSKGAALLEVQAAFRTAFGSHRRREAVLWQKVERPEGLVPLLTREVPERYRAPGTWMHDALELRDRWRSRLLRSASWSPWL